MHTHIHSAIEDENVALSMQIAQTVRECIRMVEKIGSISLTKSIASPRSVCSRREYTVQSAGASMRSLTFRPKPSPFP